MRIKFNLISSLIMQFITIVSGMILPRLIISTFGSEVNGLLSSITQFLSMISLLEGGLGAVVLAELYVPIENNDKQKISQILNACEKFFRNVSYVFIVYTLFLMVIYPILWAKGFSFKYTSSLILILSFNTLIQYLFSITNKLLLQANQKLYICNIVTSITVIINLVLSVIIIKIYPDIHITKFISSLIYLIQPIVYNYYVKKHYRIDKKERVKGDVLKERWSGFSQNIAYFINLNSSVVIITVFLSLKSVSVYTVYMLVMNGLRSVITTIANSYQSALGKYIAQNNIKNLQQQFMKFNTLLWMISSILFGTCLLLINQFISIYTIGITDADYFQPMFALIMVLAQFTFCIRESYRILVLAGGKFKDTNLSSIIEAIINIVVSLILVNLVGIIGVAIGMLISVLYRLVYFIVYLKDNIIFLKIKANIKLFFSSIVFLLLNIIFYFSFPVVINNYCSFFIMGLILVIIEIILYLIIYFIINKIIKI